MKTICLLLCVFTFIHTSAQEKQTANTLKLSNNTVAGKASIDDIKWLAGHWTGNALGGVSEELWTPPMAGSMLGSYRMVMGDTAVIFQEILNISEQDGSLTMRLKHFNKDLTGWEAQNEVREFKLVKMEQNTAWFEGMTLQKIDDKTLRVYLAIQQKDGTIIEEVFNYKKQNTLH